MHPLAQKQMPAQRTKSAISTTHSRGFSSQNQVPSFILPLQRTIGNQAVQRLLQANGEQLEAGPDTKTSVRSIVQEVSLSPGQPLDSADTEFFEPRFGHDFSKVRIHDDVRAAASARAVDAIAYTVGQHIVFDNGAYAPRSLDGRRLLAHELAHVVQQSASAHSPGVPPCEGAKQPRLSPGDAEMAADRAAGALPSLERVGPCGAVAAGTLQRQPRALTPARIELLRQLARNPQNFAAGRGTSWQRLTSAEQGAVMMAMDQYYGVQFTTAFVRFATAGQLVAGGINLSRGGTLGEAVLDRTDRSLWRTPRFPPTFPACQTLVYPNGMEFARCAPAPAEPAQATPETAAQQIRRAVDEARSLQAAGNLRQAMTVLERARPAMERLERDAAVRAGLNPSVTDPEAVIDFIVRRGSMFFPVRLPPEVVDWRTLYNELRAGRTGPPSDDEFLEELLQDEPPPAP